MAKRPRIDPAPYLKSVRPLTGGIDPKVKGLRTTRPQGERELVEACLFSYGWACKMEQPVFVIDDEDSDYDFVIGWTTNEDEYFATVQLKEVVATRRNPRASTQLIIDKLARYPVCTDLTVAIRINQTIVLDLDEMTIPPNLKIAGLWIYAAASPDGSRWLIYGDLMKPNNEGWFFSIAILVGLFLVQRKGTAFIGNIFGPVMLLWFLVIGVLGLRGIIGAPNILGALSPHHALIYLAQSPPGIGFAVLGAAFLTLTGAEAMYADMGHFGPFPIRLGWFGVVFPALSLNYLGQGGLLLSDASAVQNPFYLLAPGWAHYPMVTFATIATVIASQSIISGAYSLTQQAIQLGFLPRMRVLHTASHKKGQIYMPLINWLLAAGTLGAVIMFGSSPPAFVLR